MATTKTTVTENFSRVLYYTDDPTTARFFIPVNAPGEGSGGGGIDYGTDAQNTAAQKSQCETMVGYNATTGRAWGQAQLGRNVVGVAEVTVTLESGTSTANSANVYEVSTLLNGAPGDLTFSWQASGAGLTANTGAAVAGEPLQRSFTPTAAGQLIVQCTVSAADGANNIGFITSTIT